MGQATLPLKGAIPCNPSDSEETEAIAINLELSHHQHKHSTLYALAEQLKLLLCFPHQLLSEEVSGPRALPVLSSAKPPAKLRSVKSRLSAQPQAQPMTDTPTSTSNSFPQQMAMYQTMPWQQTHLPAAAQQFMRNGSVQQFSVSPQYSMDGQLFPIVPHMITPQMIQAPVSTPSAIPSPDSHLSVFLSETRTHNSEVRMGVAKVTEKVDQVLSKLDTLQLHQPSQALSISSVDPSALLASVQKLVSENGQLRNELVEKRTKVDELNDKMYQLLHTNQKYLEQSNSRMEHSQDTHLQTLILTLQQEKEKLSMDLSNALARVDSLQSEVKNLQKTINQLTEHRSALSAQLQTMQAELENKKSNSQEAYELEEQLRGSLQSRALVDESVKNLQSNISQLESEQALLQKQLSSANERLEKEGKATENHLNELAKKHKDQIDELKRKLEIQTHNNKSSIDKNSIEEEIQQRLNIREKEIAEKYSVVIKQLEQNHVDLKRQLKEFNNKGVAKSDVDDVAVQSIVVDEVKKGVTLQLLENGKTSKSGQIEALNKNPVKSELSQETSESASKNAARTRSPDASVEISKVEVDLSVNEELIQATSDHEEESVIVKRPENKVLVDEIKVKGEAEETVQNKVPKVRHSEPISASLTPVKPENTMKQSRESSLERGWRPQPPPPPLFDDDDDDDDWFRFRMASLQDDMIVLEFNKDVSGSESDSSDDNDIECNNDNEDPELFDISDDDLENNLNGGSDCAAAVWHFQPPLLTFTDRLQFDVPNEYVGNTGPVEQIDLACDVMKTIMTCWEPGAVLAQYKIQLQRALGHPTPQARVLVLQELNKVLSDGKPMSRLNESEDLLLAVIDCVRHEDSSVYEKTKDVLTKLGATPEGLRLLYGQTLLNELINSMGQSVFIQIVTDVSVNSGSGLQASHTSGLLPSLISELDSDDILLQLNALELFSKLAVTPHGFQYFHQRGVLATLADKVLNTGESPFGSLLLPGLIKFFGNVAHSWPQEILTEFPSVVKALFEVLNSSDFVLLGTVMETLGFIGTSPQGKQALHNLGDSMSQSMKMLGNNIKTLPAEWKVRALNTVANLIQVKPDDQTPSLQKITRSWFDSLATDPMELIMHVGRQPFPELKLAVLQVLNVIGEQQWGQEYIKGFAGLIEFLLDRSTESTKLCKDAKFEVLRTIVSSPTSESVFGSETILRFKNYIREGPVYVHVETEVAIEGSS
uniref:26S proteasome non-ATPase regulatory subunit 5 n=1 Tax=Timema bartmani TaxID=61472 RepID=A0A7R9EUT6_9NEOP|nr:unnamed protein product [Timema bartmani]